MIQKLFPLDKNYILRQAQSILEEQMLEVMVFELKKSYTQLYNPLMLMDETFAKILDTYEYPKDRLRMIYRQLCGIYRFKNKDNQLELLFDGRTHLEKFQEDWSEAFVGYIQQLGQPEMTQQHYGREQLYFTVNGNRVRILISSRDDWRQVDIMVQN